MRLATVTVGIILGLGAASAISPSIAQPASQAVLGRMQLTRDAASLLSNLKPLVQQRNSLENALGSVANSKSVIVRELQLTGDRGYLLRVDVEKEPATGITSVLGEPRLMGSGEDPAHILARNMSRSAIAAAPRSGFVLSKKDSFYLWAQLDATDKDLVFGTIVTPFSEAAELEATQIAADVNLFRAMQAERSSRIIGHTIEVLQKEAWRKSSVAEMGVVLANIRNDDREIGSIRTKLKDELERAAKADAFVSRLNMVKGNIAIGLLIAEATSLFPSSDFSKADSDEELAKLTVTRMREHDGIIVQMKGELSIRERARSQSTSTLSERLRSAGVPDSIIRELNSENLQR